MKQAYFAKKKKIETNLTFFFYQNRKLAPLKKFECFDYDETTL